MMSPRIIPALALAVIITAPPALHGAGVARTITITAGDNMKYSIDNLTAKRGEKLRLVLKPTGTMPKVAMAHNIVVLQKGTDPAAFANASVMARENAYIAPGFAKQVVAATPLAGNGETVEVTFTVPAAPGKYAFLCSFPGHFLAGMRGTLNVT
jgi:azurin